MNVLILATGVDTGGQGGRIVDAFAEHAPDVQIASYSHHSTDFGYPGERKFFSIRQHWANLRPVWEAADVVHLRNYLRGWQQMDKGRGKPIVLHHHGSNLRLNARTLPAEARKIGALQAVSTLDLLMHVPDAEWVPSPYDVAELIAMRRDWHVPSDTLRIAHLPTNVEKKSSRHVVDAAAGFTLLHNLRTVGRRLKLRTVPWEESMRIKAQADIYVDQFATSIHGKPYPGGYGNNAIEAWGMGIPVVAGVSEPTRSVMVERFGELPFVEANTENLAGVLRTLANDADMRAEFARRGHEHVWRWHSGEETVRVLRSLYERAPATSRKVASVAA